MQSTANLPLLRFRNNSSLFNPNFVRIREILLFQCNILICYNLAIKENSISELSSEIQFGWQVSVKKRMRRVNDFPSIL